TLPAARATGNLTLKANAVVERLVYDPEQQRVREVQVIDSETGERQSFTARLFFLCASTVGSTQILLNSRSEEFPNGLANRSGALRFSIMDYVHGPAALGFVLDGIGHYWYGNRPIGPYFPLFCNHDEQSDDADFVPGYGHQGDAFRM